MTPNLKSQQMACESCRKRKRKCDFNDPCAQCIRLCITCVPRSRDRRSEKVRNSYVQTLETQVKTLEKSLEKFQQGSNSNIWPSLSEQERKDQDLHIVSGRNNGSLSVYGPSSIFIPSNSRQNNISKQKIPAEPTETYMAIDFEDFHNPWILDCIAHFFKYKYPDLYIFIHRESFLTDFFKGKDDVKLSLSYCNEELIYSICAIGADIIGSSDEYGEHCWDSQTFYSKAKKLVLDNIYGASVPFAIPTIQCLLCLALYDLGRGEESSCWLLSGLALRIGQQMGFEFDPTNWKLEKDQTVGSSPGSTTLFSQYDIEVKSRIYWGCYLVDHFVSLVLGRHPTLQKSTTTIPDSDELPRLKGIEAFVYFDDAVPYYDYRLDVCSMLKSQVDLYTICETFHDRIFFSDNNSKNAERITQLSAFNLSLQNWRRNLPSKLKWTRATLKVEGHNHVLMSARFHFYLVLLSYNRPFVTRYKDMDQDVKISLSTSITLCLDTAFDLYCSFKKFHATVASDSSCGTLVMVYNTILCITILTSLFKSKLANEYVTVAGITSIGHQLKLFIKVLKRFAKTWNIAESYIQFMESSLDDSFSSTKEMRADCSNSEGLVNPVSSELFDINAGANLSILDNVWKVPILDDVGILNQAMNIDST